MSSGVVLKPDPGEKCMQPDWSVKYMFTQNGCGTVGRICTKIFRGRMARGVDASTGKGV